jgi:DNA-binding CsgD family transcriptional regulator
MNPIHALTHGAEDALHTGLLRQLVDALDFGAMLLERDGRIRWANRPAREALAMGDALGMTEGRLSLHGPQQQRALAGVLEEAAAGATRMLCLGGGVPSTKLGLAPWGCDADGVPLLLVTLQTGEREQWPALRAYAREHRLTQSETDVMQQLVLGDRPPQIAARRGSSEGTVRSQIKSLLEKTGTHSMRELVVEVLHLPPMPAAAWMQSGTGPRPGSPLRRRLSPTPVLAVRTGHEAPRAAAGDPLAKRAERPGTDMARRASTLPDRGALLGLVARQFAWPPAA